MQRAAIAYGNGELEAHEQDEMWTVRLANLEVRASYLDLALAELLGSAPEAHRTAATLLCELEDVVEQQEATFPPVAPARPRERRRSSRQGVSAKPALFGGRVVVLAAVAGAAFMLTTWLSAFR